jgi:hypothetical protein
MAFTVLIDDNFHYMDESERTAGGSFATAEEAIAEARRIVDRSLHEFYKPGITFADLMSAYCMFGEDPFIRSDASPCPFSARDYARARCAELCGESSPPASSDGQRHE